MARKKLPGMSEICFRLATEPGEYLIGRLKEAIESGDHETAERIAIAIMPYTRRRMAADTDVKVNIDARKIVLE